MNRFSVNGPNIFGKKKKKHNNKIEAEKGQQINNESQSRAISKHKMNDSARIG